MMKRHAISSPKSVSVNLYPVVLDLSHLDSTAKQWEQKSSRDSTATANMEITQSNKNASSTKDKSMLRRALPKSAVRKNSPTDNVRSNASDRRIEQQEELRNLQESPQVSSSHRRLVSANATINASSNQHKTMIQKFQHHGGTFLKTHRRAHSEGAQSSFISDTSATLFSTLPSSWSPRFQDHYVLTRQIFQNKHSDIFECIQKKSGLRHCVKILKQTSCETEILKVAQGSPQIVKLVEIIEETDPAKTFVVMELLDEANLLSRVVQTDGLDEATVKTIARDLLHGIQHLHKLGITHNNLHPSNVLTVNQDDDGLRVKIADFGHASRDGIKNHSNLNYTKTERCTIKARNIFQAPEHVTTQASDMWSVGALLCFCITGGEILHEKSHERLVQKLQGDMGKTNGKYASLSRCGKQLLCALLHADPTVRLTVAEALEHKWFADTQEHIQSGIKKAESIPGQRGRGQKQSLRKFRDSSHSESDRRSSTFTHSVTKMVQHFSNRKS